MLKSRQLISLLAGSVLMAAPMAASAGAAGGDGGLKLSTMLNGASEAPGPGDTDGSGSFSARVNHGQGQMCYKLNYTNVGTATAAHIHIAPAGSAGPVSVPLTVEADGSVEECVQIDKDLAKALMQSPANYYVNVHNAEFPAGAIRGQLTKG